MSRGNQAPAILFANRKPQGRTIDLQFIRSLLERNAREESQFFWAEGCRNFHAAIQAGRPIEAIVCCPKLLRGREPWSELLAQRRRGTPYAEVTQEEFLSISTHLEPHGIGVLTRQHWDRLIETSPKPEDIWVVLDNVRTAGNLGTILRTCAAVGATGIMLVGGEADPHEPACIRASMGAIFNQRLIRTSAKALEGWRRRHPCRMIGTSPTAQTHYRKADYQGPLLIVMGNERSGLRDRQMALCDQMVRLPMKGEVDSLNLAIATAVILYEAIEQRE